MRRPSPSKWLDVDVKGGREPVRDGGLVHAEGRSRDPHDEGVLSNGQVGLAIHVVPPSQRLEVNPAVHFEVDDPAVRPPEPSVEVSPTAAGVLAHRLPDGMRQSPTSAETVEVELGQGLGAALQVDDHGGEEATPPNQPCCSQLLGEHAWGHQALLHTCGQDPGRGTRRPRPRRRVDERPGRCHAWRPRPGREVFGAEPAGLMDRDPGKRMPAMPSRNHDVDPRARVRDESCSQGGRPRRQCSGRTHVQGRHPPPGFVDQRPPVNENDPAHEPPPSGGDLPVDRLRCHPQPRKLFARDRPSLGRCQLVDRVMGDSHGSTVTARRLGSRVLALALWMPGPRRVRCSPRGVVRRSYGRSRTSA